MWMMFKRLFAIVFVALIAVKAVAQDVAAVDPESTTDGTELSVIDRWRADPATIFDAAEVDLAALEYVARPLVVFADSPNQPQFVEQMRLLERDLSGLAVRDVIIITDTDPDARTDVRRTLRPRGFSLVLMDKDGRVALRKPEPWDVREIGRQIDKMPMRIQEIHDRS
jgi:hypothetical protein